jgi:VWFA-related protein
MGKLHFKLFAVLLFLAAGASAQTFQKSINIEPGARIDIRNLYGRVSIDAKKSDTPGRTAKGEGQFVASSTTRVDSGDIRFDAAGGRAMIEVLPADSSKRVDLKVTLPERTRVSVETRDGEVDVSGNFVSIDAVTNTGTIMADVPDDAISYEFLWTSSRPRYVADFQLSDVKERAAGKFAIKGRYPDEHKSKKADDPKPKVDEETPSDPPADTSEGQSADESTKNGKSKKKKKRETDTAATDVKLNFTTARGIVLLNVPPNEVSSDLRERPLTNAAKSIIRSGDSLLMDAIRRASPKYFGDYMRTLPPAKMEPTIKERRGYLDLPDASVKRVLVSVFDIGNRTIADLDPKDFEVLENGESREVVDVKPTTAPFNLVLLLDVSGSVENYVDFIRKAARSFVNTVSPNDRISIVTFNDDVHVLSGFTTNKAKLSESLDTFDAGGATAYYDGLAYTLADTLRPIHGERTAIVVLTDGDDNRSFLSFDSLAGSIQESGALIYPLYVPSDLVAASAGNPDAQLDTMRQKYMGLSTRAEGEGEKLAQISGGMYYPITRLSQIQTAYDDIVRQLRTAYSVTFKSQVADNGERKASPRLKVRVKRENAFVKLGSVVAVENKN